MRGAKGYGEILIRHGLLPNVDSVLAAVVTTYLHTIQTGGLPIFASTWDLIFSVWFGRSTATAFPCSGRGFRPFPLFPRVGERRWG